MTDSWRGRVPRGVRPGAKPLILSAVVLLGLSACGDDAQPERAADAVGEPPAAVIDHAVDAGAPVSSPTTTTELSPPTTVPVATATPPPTTAVATSVSVEPDTAAPQRPVSDVAVLTPVAPPHATEVVSTEVVAVLPAAMTGALHPPRVLISGDSTGTELAVRIGAYADAHVGQIEVFHSAFAGCGLSAGNDGRLHAWNTPTEWIDLAGCTLQWNAIPQLVTDNDVDVVIAAIGPWDGTDIRFPDGSVLNVLHPMGRALVQDAYDRFVTSVRDAGATPVFIRPATIDAEWERRDDPLDDPRRWDVMREIVDATGAAQIDLPGYLAATGLEGPAGRPDGVHLAEDVEARFIADVIVPEVLRLSIL